MVGRLRHNIFTLQRKREANDMTRMKLNNSEKQVYKSNKHIIITGALSIFFSLMTAAPNVLALLLVGGVPFIFSILFLIIKHPLFGAVCTLCFFLNRIETFTKGTLLSTVMILALTGYFAYATYLSDKDWKLRKKSV